MTIANTTNLDLETAKDLIEDGEMLGIINDAEARECNGENGKFYMLTFIVKVDKRTYRKSFSADFARRYVVNQLGVRVEDLMQAYVICKQKIDSQYRELGKFIFITINNDGEYERTPFENETKTKLNETIDILKKMGL